MQDFALARQEVVLDVEPVHGFEVAAQDGSRDQLGDGGGFAGGVFDGMQRCGADLQILFVLFVPLRDAGVEIPAVVVEARLARESFNFRARLFLDLSETHNHVGDLHASVVDIVLDVDFAAGVTQQADKRVAENRVAQVADVRGLVGIDAGVLDQNLPWRDVSGRFLVGRRGLRPSRRDRF